MKRICMILMISLFYLLISVKLGHALKIFDILVLDQEFYENNQTNEPSLFKIKKLEYPAWLLDQKDFVSFDTDYSGIINIGEGKWKGSRAYSYSNELFFVYNSKKQFSFIRENTFAAYILYDNFLTKIINPSDKINVNYRTRLFNPKVAWNFSFLKYMNAGVSLGYYNNEFSPDNSLLDYGAEIAFKPSFFRYTKNSALGFRRVTDSFSSQLQFLFFIKEWDFLQLKWLSDYLKRINEFYLIHPFGFNEHQFIVKAAYSIDSPEELRAFLDYSWGIFELSLLTELRSDIEKGPVSLTDYRLPDEYQGFVPGASGFISIKYENRKYGAKTAIKLNKKNKIGISFLRNEFTIESSGTTKTDLLQIAPFTFSQSLKVQEDQTELFYIYQSDKWKVGSEIKYITLRNRGGKISYWSFFEDKDDEPINFDTVNLFSLSMKAVRHFRKFDIALRIDQYAPSPFSGEKKKSTPPPDSQSSSPPDQNPPPSPPPSSTLQPQKSFYDETINFLKQNLFQTGFVTSINFTYYYF